MKQEIIRKLSAAVAMSLVVGVSLAACGGSSSSTAAGVTKTGSADGFGGAVTATLTVDANGTVTDCKLEGAQETESIGGAALEELSKQVVAANGPAIDGVAGATVILVSLSADNGNPTAIKTYNASGNTYEALTAPQTVAAGKPFVKVELGGGTFYFRPQNNVVLEAGSRYKYTVKVNATGLTLEGCTIGSWVDGGGESGEAEDLGYIYDSNTKTYTVYNANGLLAWNKAIQKDESINCTLTADIDLTGREWTRLDTWPGYSGVFNGQGHSITGLNFSAARFGLFLFLNQSGVIKNLQLIDVNLDGSSGGAAGMVDRNHGQIIACSVTGKLTVHSGGIANANYGDIIACWFNGTLKDEAGCGTIVRFNYKNITSCYWGGNAEQGVLRNEGGTVVATKVDGATVKWQTAVDGMNTALTGNDYQWTLGTGGLPVLKRNNKNP